MNPTTRLAMSPADEAAAKYMAHKGYPDIVPTDVDKVEGEPCWYYVYELPEGTMELEVDFVAGEWQFTVFFDD